MARRIALAAVAAISLMLLVSHAEAADPYALAPNTRITLERGMCYGACPVYKVEIFGDGRVLFSSDKRYGDWKKDGKKLFAYPDGVLLPGTHEDRIDPKLVSGLLKSFAKARFFSLRDEYAARMTDMSATFLTLENAGRRKTLVDYVGEAVGMPKAITEIENQIDSVAMTSRWVDGTPDLIPWLEKRSFNFRSPEAGQLVAAAAAHPAADEALVQALLDRGAPLGGTYVVQNQLFRGGQDQFQKISVAQGILEGAIELKKLAVFSRIVKSDWSKKLDKDRAAQVFARSGAGCSPELVDAVSASGIEIDALAPRDSYEGAGDAFFVTALSSLGTGYGLCAAWKDGEPIYDEDRQLETARRLIAHGADIYRRNSRGETLIFGVQSVPVLKFLLDAGLDAKAVDNRGLSALFEVAEDEAAFALLRAGASPAGRTEYCETLLDHSKIYPDSLPKFRKWLLAHPEAWKYKAETRRPCTPP